MKPYIHALSSARKWGGVPEDYLPIHDLLDSSKGACADHRHRALTHNAWFVREIIERIFGTNMVNSDGKTYSTREIAEQHVYEDMRQTIPPAVDYLAEMEYKPWMGGQGVCPSHRKLVRKRKVKIISFKEETK